MFVFPDQFRIQSLGFWSQAPFGGLLRGGDPVVTPHLDAFARESLVLTRATSTAPLCTPFRAMLFSGRYPEANGVRHNCHHDSLDCSFDPAITTLTDVLAEAGYDCGYIGKWHLDFPHLFDPSRPDWHPGARPDGEGAWDVYTPPQRQHSYTYWHSYGTFDVHKDPHYWDRNGNRTDPGRWSPLYETDVAVNYIRNTAGQRHGDRPFALFVVMNPPHTPNRSLDDCGEDFRHSATRELRELLARPNSCRDGDGPETMAARYCSAQVTAVDRAFGRIVASIDEAGLRDDTVVVFTADHGEVLCSHGRRGKNRVWSECFDIPFLLRYPDAVAPQADDLLLTPVDILPTLLGVMGLGRCVPPGVDGTDYSPLWTGDGPGPDRPASVPLLRNAPRPRDGAGMQRGYVPAARGIKTHQHTLAMEDIDSGSARPVLFDDEEDPYQMHPIDTGRCPELVGRLLTGLADHCEHMAAPWRPAHDRRSKG